MLHKFSTNPVTSQRISETLWICQPGIKTLPEEKVNGRVPGSFATFALVGRRPGKGICCFPLPLWGWHLFSLSLFFLRSPWVLGNTAIHLFFIVSFLFICLLSLAWRAEDEETSPALFTFPCFSNSLYYFILFSYLLSLLLIALLLLARWFSSPSVIFHWYSSLWCILPAVCLNALSRWNTQPLTFLDCSFHSTPYEQKHYSYTPKQFCIGFFSAEQHWPWIPAL